MGKTDLKSGFTSFLGREWKFIALWGMFSAVYAFLWARFMTYDVMFYDSAYQYYLDLHPFGRMMDLIKEDYSPPLYSVALKVFSLIFGNSLNTLRAFNVISFSGLFLACLFPLRRLIGARGAVLSAAMILGSNYAFFFGHVIRPTTLAYVLSTVFVIYAALYLADQKRKDLVMMSIFAVLSMYTHYNSLMIAFCSYAAVLVFLIIRRDLKGIKEILISGAAVSVLYIPWLFVLIKQMSIVAGGYWTIGKTPVTVVLYYMIFGIFDNYKSPAFMGAVIAACGVVIFLMPFLAADPSKIKTSTRIGELFDRKKTESAGKQALRTLPLLIFLCLSFAAFYIYSYINEIQAGRYFFIFTGMVIIILASVLTLFDRKCVITAVFAALFIADSVVNLTAMDKVRNMSETNRLRADLTAEEKESDITFYCMYEWELGIAGYIFPDASILISSETRTVLNDLGVFDDVGFTPVKEGESLFDHDDVIYLYTLESFHDKDNIPDYLPLEKGTYEITYVGKYKIPYMCSDSLYADTEIFRLTPLK